MRAFRSHLAAPDLILVGGLGLLTLGASYLGVRSGATIGVGVALVVALYLGMLLTFLRAPHVGVALIMVIFPLVPALKVFSRPEVGAVKDVISLAAISAAALLWVGGRRRPERGVALLVGLLLALYLIDVRGGHGREWATGLRLTGEPLLLLLVGLLLPNPRRNLRWAVWALIGMTVFNALYGLLQQVLGGDRLVSLGYQYNQQIRYIGGHLRSFGTFDDPFAYAVFLLFGFAAIVFYARRGMWAWVAAALILAGTAASLVRTAALILVGLFGVLLWRGRRPHAAVFFLAGAALAGLLTLTSAGGTNSQPFTVYTRGGGSQLINRPVAKTSVVLNGRVSAWQAAVGSNPVAWVFGRGVGRVGTAAQRSQYTFAPSSGTSTPVTPAAGQQTQAVDSGYFATLADVGILGLGVLLLLLAQLARLSVRLARAGAREGWLALGLLISLLIDALTRASFTGFPTAFVCLLLLGITLAAGAERPRPGITPS